VDGGTDELSHLKLQLQLQQKQIEQQQQQINSQLQQLAEHSANKHVLVGNQAPPLNSPPLNLPPTPQSPPLYSPPLNLTPTSLTPDPPNSPQQTELNQHINQQPKQKPKQQVNEREIKQEPPPIQLSPPQPSDQHTTSIPPDSLFIPDSLDIRPVAHLHSFVEGQVVFTGILGLPVLDIGNLLCDHQRFIIGKIRDVFGRVSEPYYSVEEGEIREKVKTELSVGAQVYAPTLSSYVIPANIYSKGCDASGKNDLELPDSMIEFSDDEEERKKKKQKKKNRERKKEEGRKGRKGENRRGKGEYTETYNPLPRPSSFSNLNYPSSNFNYHPHPPFTVNYPQPNAYPHPLVSNPYPPPSQYLHSSPPFQHQHSYPQSQNLPPYPQLQSHPPFHHPSPPYQQTNFPGYGH